jgi:hypothetical protein
MKAIESATGVGTIYARFGELVQNAATELNVIDSRRLTANEVDRTFVAAVSDALSSYKDSLSIWSIAVQNGDAFCRDQENASALVDRGVSI